MLFLLISCLRFPPPDMHIRDMAHIVEKQGVVIDKVAESAESSRERAEAGLGQLNQAAAYQPGCFIS